MYSFIFIHCNLLKTEKEYRLNYQELFYVLPDTDPRLKFSDPGSQGGGGLSEIRLQIQNYGWWGQNLREGRYKKELQTDLNHKFSPDTLAANILYAIVLQNGKS